MNETEKKEEGLVIAPDQLSEVVLEKIIEEFVLEEGTDYGLVEYSLESKVRAVKKQLEKKEVLLVFNPETETCSIRRR